MKFLLYLIIIGLLAIGIHWFIKTVFGTTEVVQTASSSATQPTAGTYASSAPAAGMPGDVTGVMAAQTVGNSINQNSSPINKTKAMQRVQNINDQHNKAISKQ